MRFFKTVFLCFLLLNGFIIAAQPFPADRTEVYFSFPMPDASVFRYLLNTISVDDVSDNTVYAYANETEFKLFLEQDLAYEILPHPGDVDFDLNMKTWEELQSRDLTEGWDFYPTYEAYVALMYQFEADYPDLVEIINIGETVMGRDLLFARISADIDTPAPVPQFMYTSTMHGDETAGFILSLRLIHHLISNYGEDDDITALVNSVDIWICPNENPDGTYTNNNATVAGAIRGNANGVDLNRNYPNPVNDPIHPQQIETTAMINFTDTISFIMSANMHGGIELVNFPFDSWKSWQNTHADHNWWEYVMYEYVDTVHHYSPPGYMMGMDNGVTHGGDWYVVYGSRQDYFNYYRSCREFTLELSNQKLLNPALLPAHWEYNYRSLLNYIRQSTYGIHGLVYDNQTGDALSAEIFIPGHDSNNSEVSTTMPFGDYHRPLFPGQYNVTFSADQYSPITIHNVGVNYYQTSRLNIALGDGVSNNIAEVSFAVEGMGHIERFSGTQLFNDGAHVFLHAVPGDDWMFEQWIINGEYFDDQELIYALSGDTEIIALFVEMPQEPIIALDPYDLDFGMRLTGLVHTKILTVKNLGNAPLSVHLDLEGDDAFSLEHPASKSSFDIEPGNEKQVPVYFLPLEEDDYLAQLVINSNDPYMYAIIIPVTGTAVDEAAIINLSHRVIDFGQVNMTESAEAIFYVFNDGNLPFTLEDIVVAGDAFQVEGTYPVTLDPGGELAYTVRFNPQEAADYEQVAMIHSDAMNETETELLLMGSGADPTGIARYPHTQAVLAVFPNPLTWESQFSIRLYSAEDVDVAVYNLQGRMIGRVFAGHLSPGEHSFSLSSVYQQMNSGIYLLVARAGPAVITHRMLRIQ